MSKNVDWGNRSADYLFEEYLSYPLREAYADNLVQICPRHAIHGTTPARKSVFL